LNVFYLPEDLLQQNRDRRKATTNNVWQDRGTYTLQNLHDQEGLGDVEGHKIRDSFYH